MENTIKNSKKQFLMGITYKALFMLITSINALLIVKFLTPEELGVWYIFMALQTLLFILNNALIPNVSRQYSIGITELGRNFNARLLHKRIMVFYRRIMLIAAAIGVIFTLTYLRYVINIFSPENQYILFAWVIIFISILMEIYFTSYECAISGYGEFKKVYRINFLSRLFLTFLTYLIFYTDNHNHGLYIFCAIYLMSNIFKRMLLIKLFDKIFKKEKKVIISRETDIYYRRIKGELKKLWLLSFLSSIGNVLVVRSGIFVLPFYVSIQKVASYGLTYQLFELGFNVIFTLTTIATPGWISYYKINSRKLKKSYTRIKYLSLSIMLVGGLIVSLFGNTILEYAKIEIKIQSTLECVYLLIIFLLQLNHGVSGHLLTIQNKIPYAYASFFSGILTLVLSIILIKHYAISGAIYALFISQALYNNWKWPYEAYKFLRTRIYV